MKKLETLTKRYLAALTLVLPLSLGAQTATTPAELTPAQRAADGANFGVMVMAHGGGDDWNAGMLELVAPLRAHYPLEVAFGMADAVSLQEAASRLQAQGVDEIAVIKLFISGESWHERTGQILGLVEGAPARPAPGQHDKAQHHEHGNTAMEPETADIPGHSMEFWRLDSAASFSLSSAGLAEAPETSEVLLDRALALSQAPAQEEILILAHGPASDEENARWLQSMEQHAALLRDSGFHAVKTATLREDWPDKRAAAEQEARAFVAAANAAGRSVIVLPFRVHGFGPYAEVLAGLDYIADGTGLVPHPAIGRWIQRQVEQLR